MKTNVNGQKEWEKEFGGMDSAKALVQTTDGGYVITGNIDGDVWLFKITLSEMTSTTQSGPGFEYNILILSINLLYIAQKWKRRHKLVFPSSFL